MLVRRLCTRLLAMPLLLGAALSTASPAQASSPSGQGLPTVHEVAHSFLPIGTTAPKVGVRIQLAWKVSGGTGGICLTTVERHRSDGAIDSWITYRLHQSFIQLPAYSYTFTLWAQDCTNVQGPKVTTRPIYTAHYSEQDVTRFGPDWKVESDPDAVGGATATNRTDGAHLARRLCYSNLGWIAAIGPLGGTARVYVDGVLAGTVDLHSSTAKTRQLVFTTLDSANGCHRLEIVNAPVSPQRAQLSLDDLQLQRD